MGGLSVYVPASGGRAESYQERATLWNRGKPVDLNKIAGIPQGWILMSAKAINNKGQIVGWGGVANHMGNRAFLLTPVKATRASRGLSRNH